MEPSGCGGGGRGPSLLRTRPSWGAEPALASRTHLWGVTGPGACESRWGQAGKFVVPPEGPDHGPAPLLAGTRSLRRCGGQVASARVPNNPITARAAVAAVRAQPAPPLGTLGWDRDTGVILKGPHTVQTPSPQQPSAQPPGVASLGAGPRAAATPTQPGLFRDFATRGRCLRSEWRWRICLMNRINYTEATGLVSSGKIAFPFNIQPPVAQPCRAGSDENTAVTQPRIRRPHVMDAQAAGSGPCRPAPGSG